MRTASGPPGASPVSRRVADDTTVLKVAGDSTVLLSNSPRARVKSFRDPVDPRTFHHHGLQAASGAAKVAARTHGGIRAEAAGRVVAHGDWHRVTPEVQGVSVGARLKGMAAVMAPADDSASLVRVLMERAKTGHGRRTQVLFWVVQAPKVKM